MGWLRWRGILEGDTKRAADEGYATEKQDSKGKGKSRVVAVARKILKVLEETRMISRCSH